MTNDRFKYRIYDVENKRYVDNPEDFVPWDLPDGLIAEQCTGIKDENDNIVFEGDIVDVPFEAFDGIGFYTRDILCVVVHFNGSLMFRDKDGEFHYLDETDFAILEKEFLTAKVVGNIHESGDK